MATKKVAKKAVAKKKATKKKAVAKKVVVTKTDKSKEDAGGIELVVSVNEQVFTFDTAEVSRTMLSIPEMLGGYIKTRMIVTATYDGKTVEKVFMTAFAKRLTTNKVAADVFEKGIRLVLAFNG